MLRDERILDLAEIHCDLDTDSRGRKSFEFDNHGVVAFARAVEQAAYAAAIKACEGLTEVYDRQQDSKFLTDDGKMLYEGMWGGTKNCAEAIRSLMEQPQPECQPVSEPRPCTCHPDDNPPVPCAQQYALNECRAASEPTEAQIEARDALLDFISENGTASEGVQHYIDRYVRAALAARETK